MWSTMPAIGVTADARADEPHRVVARFERHVTGDRPTGSGSPAMTSSHRRVAQEV